MTAAQMDELAARFATGYRTAADEMIRQAAPVIAKNAINAAAPGIAQRSADATVKALRDAGLLRETPAETVRVKRLVRDARGAITSIVERIEQVEPEP